MHLNLSDDILFIIPFITIIVWLRWHHKKNQSPLIIFFYPTLIWKLSLGLLLGILYQYYYPSGDTFNLFQNAQRLTNYSFINPSGYFKILFFSQYQADFFWLADSFWEQPRALFTARLLSVINLLTGNTYHMTSLFLSFFSFWSMWTLANQLVKIYPKSKYASLFAFLIFPSVIFWSSGVSKECLFWIPFGFALTWFLRLINGELQTKTQYLFASIVWLGAIVLGFYLKFYYTVVALPCILAYWVVSYISSYWQWKSFTIKLSLLIACFMVFSIIASFTHPAIQPNRIMDRLVRNHNANFHFSNMNDVIHYRKIDGNGYYNLHSSVRSLGYNVHLAFYSGIFRPLPYDAKDNFISLKGLVSLENTFIVILFLVSILFLLQNKPTVDNPLLVVVCLFYIIILVVLLAFAAPNFGTLARYKVGFMPFLLYLLFCPISYKLETIKISGII